MSETKTKSEQAEDIAEIQRRHMAEVRDEAESGAHSDRGELLQIVDSQAQKIEQLEADISNLLNKLVLWRITFERQEKQIAEARKFAESMISDIQREDGVCLEKWLLITLPWAPHA